MKPDTKKIIEQIAIKKIERCLPDVNTSRIKFVHSLHKVKMELDELPSPQAKKIEALFA